MGNSSDNDNTAGFSILNPDSGEFEPLESTPFFRDLNLDQVIDRLTYKWGKNVKKYFRYIPQSPGEVSYRRDIYRDIKKDEVYAALLKFTEDLEKTESIRREKEKVRIPLQRNVWQIREVGSYCDVYEELAKSLESAGLTSGGMKGFLSVLKEILESGGYRRMREQIKKVIDEIRKLRFVITYDKDRMSVELKELEGEGSYGRMLREQRGGDVRNLQNPFIADSTLTEMEKSCLEIIQKKKPELFAMIERTAEMSEGYEKEVLHRFEREVIFYLSFRSLQLEMEEAGFRFAEPEADEDKKMEAKGLYDMALAITNHSKEKEVVPNDLSYEEGERFFVLTGPNQGGKTTFARSLGQLVYLAQLGLDVPAQSANVHFFPDIQTHFSVEESVETGRGKLKEELVRLAPMMEEHKQGTFVVINELFTTAASYDAEIMGRNVLEHFIALGCMGIYVTHLRELCSAGEGVVSLKATLDDHRVQTFKIIRGEADDTACAENVVNKYRLTYEQLKERL
ncbi:MAG: hypothetical protein IKI46_02895 [Lachnospiraceae bacterium]|nr:hypothetical protein [Lachnospiraceae bacterium]